MKKPLRVLIVEDSEDDTLLLVRELKRCGYDPSFERVETRESMGAALSTKTWDLILADYSMPHFSGLKALEVLKENGLDLPFIIVSGTIGENVAVEVMKAGAHDYIMKDKLKRLVPAIEQELREAGVRRKLKESEKALQESEERYKQVVENATEIIYTIDERGNFTYGNPAGLRVTGYSLGELRQLNYADLVVPDHRERVSQIYINQFREKLLTTYVEFPFFSKAGEIIWFGQNSTLVMEGDKITGFHIIARDITERKRAEEALRKSEQRYRTIFEESTDAIYTTSQEGEILDANRSMFNLFGYSREEMIGLKARETYVFSEDQLKFQHKIEGEGFVRDYEIKLRKKDGTEMDCLLTATVRRTADGNILGYQGVIRDIIERKRAEEVYRTILRTTMDGFWMTDIQGLFLDVNDAYCHLMGYSRDELLTMRISDVEAVERPEETAHRVKRIIETGGARFETCHRCKDGKFIDVEVSVNYAKIGNERLFVFLRDITERKKAEEALRWSEERYRTLIETSPDAITLFDLNLNIMMANPPALKLFGYDRQEEVVGKSVLNFLAPEQLARAREDAGKVLETGSIGTVEYTLLRKNGTVFPAELKASLILNRQKKPSGVLCVIRDVTERKRAEENLKQSEENARRLAQENSVMAEIGKIISSTLNIGDVYELFAEEVRKLISFDRIMINITDLDRKTVSFAYISGIDTPGRRIGDVVPLAGTATEEVLRTRSRLLVQTENIEEAARRFPGLMPSFQAGLRSIIFVPLIFKDQMIGTLSIRSNRPNAYTDQQLKLSENIATQIAGAIANARLFAEHVRSEEDKAVLQEQLRQSQKMEAIGRLAGGVAHDFNNLLTVIKGYSQLSLDETEKEDPLRENIEEIRKASDRAADLTRQLLAFSRRQVMEMRVLDLNELLTNLDKMLRRVIGEDIDLVTMPEKNLGRVRTDPGQMEQVIMNLAVNARDAMPNGGKLTIETANVELDRAYARAHIAVTPGRYVMISVSDTGFGMTPEIRDRVFDPFFTTKAKGKGTGLGLSTVYGIVKQSSGNIWVYSEPGKGTTFKIYLPCVDEPSEELKERVASKELPRGSETILIVEDEEVVLKLAGRILRKQGYDVWEMLGGEEALKMCKEQRKPFHLLLTDVVMPQMGGRQLADRLKEICQDFKVLYMSGYTDNAITHHGVLDKGVNYLQKPFSKESLVKKVREVLDK